MYNICKAVHRTLPRTGMQLSGVCIVQPQNGDRAQSLPVLKSNWTNIEIIESLKKEILICFP